MSKAKHLLRRETVYDGDRWIVPGTRDTYLLRCWKDGTGGRTIGAFYFIHGRNGPPQLIRKWYAGLVADEIKWRMKTKRIHLIRRPLKERQKGCSLDLLWFTEN